MHAIVPVQAVVYGPPITGVLLYVDGFVPAGTNGLKRVYYSGNRPHLNEPPDFSLARRTMLDIIAARGNGFSLADAAELVYERKIVDAFYIFYNYANAGDLVLLVDLIREALGNPNINTNALYRDGLLRMAEQLRGPDTHYANPGAAIAGLAAPLPNRVYNQLRGLANSLFPLIGAANARADVLEATYNAQLLQYGNEQVNRYGWPNDANGRSRATHSEIMFLDDVWRQHHDAQGGGVNGIVNRIRGEGQPITRLMFDTKPMCENCEPAIVRAWQGVPQALSLRVVSEVVPTDAQLAKDTAGSNVIKIRVPAAH